jgi:hypothetical protein
MWCAWASPAPCGLSQMDEPVIWVYVFCVRFGKWEQKVGRGHCTRGVCCQQDRTLYTWAPFVHQDDGWFTLEWAGSSIFLFFFVIFLYFFYRIKFYMPYMVISRFFTHIESPPTNHLLSWSKGSPVLLLYRRVGVWSSRDRMTQQRYLIRDSVTARPRSIAERYWLGGKGGECQIIP